MTCAADAGTWPDCNRRIGPRVGRQAHRIRWLDAQSVCIFAEPESGACQVTRMRNRYIHYPKAECDTRRFPRDFMENSEEDLRWKRTHRVLFRRA